MVSIIRAEALPLRVGGRELGPSLLNGNLCRTPEGLIAFVSVGKLVFSTVDRKRGSVRAQRCHLLPSAVCTQLAAVSLAGCSVVVTTSADGCSVWHATSETPLHTVPLSALEGAAISLGSVLPDYNAGDSFARGIATLEEGSLLCVGTSSGVVAVLRAECEDSPRRLLLRSSAAPTLSLSVLKHIAHFEAADSARESAAPSLPTPMPVRAPCTVLASAADYLVSGDEHGTVRTFRSRGLGDGVRGTVASYADAGARALYVGVGSPCNALQCFGGETQLCAAAFESGQIRVFDLTRGTLLSSTPAHSRSISALGVAEEDSTERGGSSVFTLASAGHDGILSVWRCCAPSTMTPPTTRSSAKEDDAPPPLELLGSALAPNSLLTGIDFCGTVGRMLSVAYDRNELVFWEVRVPAGGK